MDSNSNISHVFVVGSLDGEVAHQLVEMVQWECAVVRRGELHGHGIVGWMLVIARARVQGLK